jgi:type I restriction enzyme R subunit
MNEAETRAEHIDPALAAAGWGVVEGSRVRREYPITLGRLEGHGRRGKPLTADYVLTYRNTKLAVVEAKAWDQALTEGVGQAKNYADKLAIRFAYSSNGQGVYGIDMQTGREGELPAFPTPDELWNRTFAKQNDWRDRFAAVPFPDKSGSWEIRFYQEIAVNRVLERIAAGKDRILLTLATGTGKTSIAFQIAWKLFQARWSLGGEPVRRPRILFLADRNTLATQAYNDFTSFNAFADDAMVRVKPDDIRKKGKVPKNASLFFTIFQTFMSGPEKDGKPSPYFGDYPPDFFDFIVIDECHRGGANDESTWRGILEYFAPAVQLGLTATPKRKDNIDTYKYFGEPVFIYSLKDGINDGFLTPFRVKQISTTLDEYVYTPDDSLIEGDIEVGKRYVEKDFNKVIEIKEREAHRVKLFMDQIQPNDKTVVFCASQAHALAARDLVNQMKTSKDPGYCQRVTANDGELGEENLRAFQDNEKTIPTILTTSQKLSTGVDARNIRNIVLMRPINSMIEFKQIIGRGTRLYDGKDYFTIYDFVRAHHHFSDPEWDGEPVEPEATTPKPPKPDDPKKWEDHAHDGDGEPSAPKRQKIKVKLADGKARTIQHMMCTTFWHPDGTPHVGPAVYGAALRQAARLLQERSRAARPVERPRHAQAPARRPGRKGFWQRPTNRDAEDHRRREERPFRRAGPRGLRPGPADPRRARPARQARHQPPFQQQAASLPRLRALSLRGRGRGRARPRQADPAFAPAIPRQHRRRRRRPRPPRRDRPRLRRLPEVPVRTGGGIERR